MNAYLDILAMICTGGSTWLFACGRNRLAYKALLVGSVLWTGVALMGSFEGRPIYGMLIGSANTFIASMLALRWHKPAIDPVYHKHLEAYKRAVERERADAFTAAMGVELEGYSTPALSTAPPDTPDKGSCEACAPAPAAHQSPRPSSP